MSQTKIGLLGGTFNPVHFGHLILAQSALEACELSRVIFIPSATPPHKNKSSLLPTEHRFAMLENALEGDPRFEVSDIEAKREGTCYSVDTIAQFRELMPTTSLYFIIGTDTLLELHLWKDIYRLLEMCTVVTFARPGFDSPPFSPSDLQLDHPWPERLLKDTFTARMIDISSSDIRHRVAEGLSIRYLVPPSVEIYIDEHHLYGR